jgi:hypothetical protein
MAPTRATRKRSIDARSSLNHSRRTAWAVATNRRGKLGYRIRAVKPYLAQAIYGGGGAIYGRGNGR